MMKKLLLLFVALLCIGFVRAALTDDLISYVPFNDTSSGEAVDVYGIYNMTGTAEPINIAGYDWFNMVSSSANMSSAVPLDEGYTVSMWLYGCLEDYAFSKGEMDGSGNAIAFGHQAAPEGYEEYNGRNVFSVYLIQDTWDAYQGYYFKNWSGVSSVGCSFNLTVPTHFIVTIENFNASLYVDSINIEQINFTDDGGVVDNVTTDNVFEFAGVLSSFGGDYYVKDFAVWDRILSGAEISELYTNDGNPLSGTPTCAICNETCSPCGGGCTATDLSSMYLGYNWAADPNGYGDITGWNTSCVTSMYDLFALSDFNQPIGSWDVSSVTDMRRMFYSATVFNQPIGSWDVSSVVLMGEAGRGYEGMFFQASSFNQDISGWNTSSVTKMDRLFKLAVSFDQNIGSWDVSQVTTVTEMFLSVNLSTPNYDAILNGWASQPVQSGLSFDGGYSMYSSAGQVGRDILTGTYSWSITDGGLYVPPCTPNWTCIGYEACVSPAVSVQCNNAYDISLCNESYAGNYSEFALSACTYPLTGGALIAANNNKFINILVIMLIIGILGMIIVGILAAFDVEINMTIIAVIAVTVVVLAIIILVISFGSITSLT